MDISPTNMCTYTVSIEFPVRGIIAKMLLGVTCRKYAWEMGTHTFHFIPFWTIQCYSFDYKYAILSLKCSFKSCHSNFQIGHNTKLVIVTTKFCLLAPRGVRDTYNSNLGVMMNWDVERLRPKTVMRVPSLNSPCTALCAPSWSAPFVPSGSWAAYLGSGAILSSWINPWFQALHPANIEPVTKLVKKSIASFNYSSNRIIKC